MRRLTVRCLILGVAAALALGACGDGDDNDDEATDDTGEATEDTGDDGDGETLSEEEYIDQADEICAANNEELEELADDAFGDLAADEVPPDDELLAFAEEVFPLVQQTVDDIRELEGPEELTNDVREILDDVESRLEEAEEEVEDDPSIILQDEGPFEGIEEDFDALGFADCGTE